MFNILVVEDDRDMNRTVCAFLNQSGYEATGCGIPPQTAHIFLKNSIRRGDINAVEKAD